MKYVRIIDSFIFVIEEGRKVNKYVYVCCVEICKR